MGTQINDKQFSSHQPSSVPPCCLFSLLCLDSRSVLLARVHSKRFLRMKFYSISIFFRVDRIPETFHLTLNTTFESTVFRITLHLPLRKWNVSTPLSTFLKPWMAFEQEQMIPAGRWATIHGQGGIFHSPLSVPGIKRSPDCVAFSCWCLFNSKRKKLMSVGEQLTGCWLSHIYLE